MKPFHVFLAALTALQMLHGFTYGQPSWESASDNGTGCCSWVTPNTIGIGFHANGTQTDGRVSLQLAKDLQTNTQIWAGVGFRAANDQGSSTFELLRANTIIGRFWLNNDDALLGATVPGGNLRFVTNGQDRMYILANGNVGIGTATPAEKLSVNGQVRARDVLVETANWPDYVFADGYPLRPLSEVARYVATYRRLPGLPAASEVEAGGLALGDMQARLLEKIEELTIYIIRQNARIEALSAEVATLKQGQAPHPR